MSNRGTSYAESQAIQILQEADCLRVPVPIELVAQRLGLRVEPALLGEEVSGVLVIEEGKGTIGYNLAHPPVRQRFSLAHEIGHYVLHHQQRGLFIDKAYTVYHRDSQSSSGENLSEIEANRFAAALLMPEVLLRHEVEHHGFDLMDDTALDRLASRFRVSRQAMSIRLATLYVF